MKDPHVDHEDHTDCPTCKVTRRIRPLSSVPGYENVTVYDDDGFYHEHNLDDSDVRVCANALHRALDAMRRSDQRLAKDEVEYVVEQMAIAGVR